MPQINFTKIEKMAEEQGLGLPGLAMAMGYKSAASLYNFRYQGKMQGDALVTNVRAKVAKRIADYFGVKVSDIAV